MHFLQSVFFRCLTLSKAPVNYCNRHNLIKFRSLCLSSMCRDKVDSGSEINNKDRVPGAMSKYELFSEHDNPVILDIEEERHKIQERKEVEYDHFHGIRLTRGVTGVFDIDELVDILKRENAKDVFVCNVPSKYCYVDHMVIVTGRSTRHMIAMAEFIRKVYKKKVNCSEKIPDIEGKNCKKWMALDLGNIALHIFSEECRVEYDLESLWCLGGKFDSISNQQSSSLSLDYSSILASLTPQKVEQNTA